MDRQIQKLQKLVKLHINQSKADLVNTYGRPCKYSDNEIWFYHEYRWGIFRDEITFIFQKNVVVDIMISQYIFWKEYKNIFYYEGKNPEYKIIKF
ncbi:hypothetical protein [Chryseobacterium sp.]|uniref:hypothetical protein n=1 Tax=Chryseobacterium sp. TaxID=1871047 RepID=UPI000ED28BD7|nr:hypothetical protein [Chryseobacterium sp.]HCM35933.1 hypothetical protein [Chryseobacterium sp.]